MSIRFPVLTITAAKLNFIWFHWNQSIVFWNPPWFQKPIRYFFWFHYGVIETILVSKRYFGPKMTKNEFLNRNRVFFFFVTWFQWFFWIVLVVSRRFWSEILKPKWFHEVQNKNKLKPLAGFNFFFCTSWIPLWFSRFSDQNRRGYHQDGSKNHWNPGHKIKKIDTVFIETQHWWYFCQKYSYYNIY